MKQALPLQTLTLIPMPYVDRKPQRETAGTWGGEGPFHCSYSYAFLSHCCWCQAQTLFPHLLCYLLSCPGYDVQLCIPPFFSPERPQPPDLHPKKSHSPASSSFVHCLCLHGSLSPFPAVLLLPFFISGWNLTPSSLVCNCHSYAPGSLAPVGKD